MIIYIKNKVLQRQDVDLNMKEFVDWTEVFAINNKIFAKRRSSTSSSKNLQIEQKYSPMHTPQFSQTCCTSCSWLQREHMTCTIWAGF
jgi:hypothetical protein